MPIITLTTDWNSEDYYIGAVKGKILSLCGFVNIIDISHRILPFNTSQAAFVLRNSFFHFPPGTIHLIFVNAEPSEKNPILIVKANAHYFIGADTGIFDLILSEEPELIIKPLLNQAPNLFETYSQLAAKIIEGVNMVEMGEEISSFAKVTSLRATIDDKTITGSVIYIDSYMNAITNITRELFERIGKSRNFEIYVQSKHYRIGIINDSYHQSPVGELLAIFNSSGLLEISINKGAAARLLNLEINSTVRVEFIEKKS
jgi:S-adenosyl-L-methionine hydrolase (adenosine-forming)